MSIDEIIVDVGLEYCPRLADRAYFQAGNEYNAQDFRDKYLNVFDSKKNWLHLNCRIIFDFSSVKKMSPGFANEAFAYFAKYANDIADIYEHIEFRNISEVQKSILEEELLSGFNL